MAKGTKPAHKKSVKTKRRIAKKTLSTKVTRRRKISVKKAAKHHAHTLKIKKRRAKEATAA